MAYDDGVNRRFCYSKCVKIVGGWGFAPDPTGELTALPRPLAGFKGSRFAAGERKGEMGGEGGERKEKAGGGRGGKGRGREGKGRKKFIPPQTQTEIAAVGPIMAILLGPSTGST